MTSWYLHVLWLTLANGSNAENKIKKLSKVPQSFIKLRGVKISAVKNRQAYDQFHFYNSKYLKSYLLETTTLFKHSEKIVDL